MYISSNPTAQVSGTAPAPQAAAPAKAAPAARDRFTGSAAGLTPVQRRRAEAMTSLFENSTQTLQYGYAEALGDGRGLTAGRAGFCSGTHDMIMVVKRYLAEVPTSPLAKYLPRLSEIDRDESQAGSVKGLEGLDKAWGVAAKDPKFRAAQDAIVDQLYYNPAMLRAQQVGVKSALGKAILYDTIIQHGNSDGYPDSLPALIGRTNDLAGGTPAQGVDERRWLQIFLQTRRADLAYATDPATRECWAESVTRVDALADVFRQGNMNLDKPYSMMLDGQKQNIP